MWMTLWDLLRIFGSIGLFSIGGGYAIIPLLQEQVVDNQQWLTQQAFTDIITISQMTPGPVAVNMSTFVGTQMAGLPGSIVATLACVGPGFIFSLVLYWFYRRYQHSNYVFEVMSGLKAGSLGLIASAAGTILLTTFFGITELQFQNIQVNWAAVGIFAGSLLLLRLWKKCNPILLMAMTGAAGCIVYGFL